MDDPRRLRPLDGAVIGMVAAALLMVVIGAPSSSQATGTSTTTRPLTTTTLPGDTAVPDVTAPADVATTTTTAAVGTTAPGVTTTGGTTVPTTTAEVVITTAPAVALADLRIDDRPATTTGYARALFPAWLDLDGDGCDTRQEVLVEEAEGPVQRDPYGRCATVVAGDWTSLYDGVHTSDPGDLDVDHLVPLAEAWRSGAHAWDAERRARFANDLDEPDHLIAVTASSNRSKGDRAPDGWRPPVQGSWCRYATAWVRVKVRWELTASTVERDALGQMLATC